MDSSPNKATENVDELFLKAVELVTGYKYAAATMLKQQLRIGYVRAAKLIDQLEIAGVVSPLGTSTKGRRVLVKSYEDFIKKGGYERIRNNNSSPKNEGPSLDEPWMIKVDTEFPVVTQASLYIILALEIIALLRFENEDVRRVFSLCMIIGATIGRHITDSVYNSTKYLKDNERVSTRRIIYNIMVICGVLGLLF